MSPPRVVVVGLGAAGSAAAYHLARAGARVVGLDRWAPPHALGSSHGRTRIIREAYYEHPLYVPLVRRAYQRWAELEREAREPLLAITGGVMVGPPDGELVAGALASVRAHGLPHELLDAAALRRRVPAFAPEDGWVGVVEPRAGMLFPERCIAAHLRLAAARGAELRPGEAAVAWRADAAGVTVETASGRVAADALVLAAGAWTASLVPELAPALAIERQTLHFFAPRADAAPSLAPEVCPIALFEHAPGRLFYTFPTHEGLVKCGVHHEGRLSSSPDAVDRAVHADDVAAAARLLARLVPGAAGPVRDSTVCLYTNTPDHHFVLDRHPAHPRVVIASACSGHGFKFASAVGELAAALALSRPVAFDLAPFAVGRLWGPDRAPAHAVESARDSSGGHGT